MLELTNLGLLLIVNAVFALPITTGIFEFLKNVRCEIDPIDPHKKKMAIWIVFLNLCTLTMYFYLVYSLLFRWRF